MILIEFNGEKQLVDSLDGYEGATVLEQDVSRPTGTFVKRKGGAWVTDEAAKAKAERNKMLAAMPLDELVDYIITEASKGQP